jgi:hypothetical protein
MKHNLALAFTWLTAASVLAAETNSTGKVKEALARLTVATNYSWTTTIKIPGMPFEPGPVKGKTEKGGWSMVSQQVNDNTVEAVFKGEKAAVKSEGEWQSLDKAEGPAAMMGGWLTASGTPDDEAGKLLKAVKELKPGDGDSLSGDLTPEGAKDFLTFHPRHGDPPPPPKDAKGSVKFWLKDGALTKFESHLQAKVAFGPDQDEQDFEITRTIEIRSVGSTKVEIPNEARKALETK